MKDKYKVDKYTFKKDFIILLLISLMFITGAILYPYLPEKIPMHWNFKGEIDRYGSKFEGVFAIPLTVLFLYLGLLYLPYIDPKRENYPKFERVYQIIKYLFVIVFSIIHYSVIISALGGPRDLIPKITPITLGILFIILGNYMPRIKYNWFVGVRTPWTLSDEEVWKRTHRFSGYLFVIGGILMLLSAFLPPYINLIIGLSGIFIAGILSVIYSLIIYKKLKRQKEN
ncbi:MAG: SdpI family protein [Dictyoglomaceae bacterium]